MVYAKPDWRQARRIAVDCHGNHCLGNGMTFYNRDNFYPETSVGYLLRVCHQHAYANLDQLFADEGLSGTQWTALISIYFERGLTCAALARDMAHDKGAMTRIVDMLEERGWVERNRDRDDRRLINLSLTDAGVAVTMRCREKIIDCWNGWLADWSPAEIEQFLAQLQKLRRTLEATPACAV
jgi:DNA-binding MarR family transcriptional regulator